MEKVKRSGTKFEVKIAFAYLETSREEWLKKALSLYTEKLSRFSEFEVLRIKSPKMGRESQQAKLEEEARLILEKIRPTDYLVLFDESGREFNSIDFSSQIKKILDTSPRRIVFLIGGAYGVSETVFQRAQLKLSLSKLVFNHHVAIVVALEQIYRSFTIQKNLPYHNP